jgi:hypothetical protein
MWEKKLFLSLVVWLSWSILLASYKLSRWSWLLAAPGWVEVGVPCLLDVLQALCPYGCLASLEKALEFAVRVTDILNVSIGGETSSVSTQETAV